MNKRKFLKNAMGGAAIATVSACESSTGILKNKKNNVMLIAIDDLNAWLIDPLRHPLCKTPNIDALMAESVRFTNAHCAAPVCASSRAAFMSGVSPHESGFYTNAQQEPGGKGKHAHAAINDVPHILKTFRDNGYHMMGAGKIYHDWVSDDDDHYNHYDEFMPELKISDETLRHGHGYGGLKFYPFPKSSPLVEKLNVTEGVSLVAGGIKDRKNNMVDGFMPDELITQWSTEKLKTRPKNKPFFMGVGYLRPHVPFTAPQKYFDAIPIDDIELPKVDDMKDIPIYGKAMTMGLIPGGDHAAVLELGEDYWKSLIHGYLACIAFIDDEIGKLLTQMVELGLDKTTDIVLLSDHGQNFGEKANWRKMCLWEESTRVPFAIRPAGGKPGAHSSSRAVSLLDMYPTLCAMHNLPTHTRMGGNDLSPLIKNPNRQWDKPVLIAWHYQNFAVRSNRWRLIRYRDGAMELYDHDNDPTETNNIVDNKEHRATVNELLAFIPQNPKLPYGSTSWKGDKLDQYVKNWTENGTPKFLN